MTDEGVSNGLGLLRCLQALSDEADTMALYRTLAALRDAVDTCREELSLLRSEPELEASLLH